MKTIKTATHHYKPVMQRTYFKKEVVHESNGYYTCCGLPVPEEGQVSSMGHWSLGEGRQDSITCYNCLASRGAS